MFEGEVRRPDILARIEAYPLGETPEAMRRDFERLVLGDDPRAGCDGVRIEEAATGLVVAPDGADGGDGAEVVWFHGGGYVFGSPETHLRPAAYLAREWGMTVTLPRYRLAPEHPWPAQFEDALAAVEGRTRPILAGDSAGGHLALVTALELSRQGRPAAGLMLFSPNTDRTGRSETRAAMSADDPMVDDDADRRLAGMCFAGIDATDPQVSPLLDDLRLLPPTWLEVGDPEVLLDDSRLLWRRANEVGAVIGAEVTEGLLHMGQLWAPWWPAACASLDRAARAMRG